MQLQLQLQRIPSICGVGPDRAFGGRFGDWGLETRDSRLNTTSEKGGRQLCGRSCGEKTAVGAWCCGLVLGSELVGRYETAFSGRVLAAKQPVAGTKT
jgi:hypothetical protein